MATEDSWVTVRPGDPFPEEKCCIRALGIPGIDPEAVCHPDSYIALWLRPDGEAVLGCAYNEGGKVEARFTWDGKMVKGEETEGFRILKFCDNDNYHWVKAKEADEHKLVYVGEYVPAVVVCGKDAALGKASWQRKMVWTCDSGAGNEACHQQDQFAESYLLAKQDREKRDTGRSAEDSWVTVRPGDPFPEEKCCIRALGIPGVDPEAICHPDSYIALWLRPDGEAVLGCAYNEGGKVEARFTWDGKMVKGEETEGFRILKFCDNDNYHWVKAKEADEHALFYVGEYVPAVVVCGKDAVLGKANLQRKMVWTCDSGAGSEACHQQDQFAESYLLAKQ